MISLTLVLGILGILGGILLCLDKKIGAYLAIIGGGLTFLGLFIQIGTFIHTPITLTDSFIYIEPLLILIGGCLGLFYPKD
jgi:hypothetical protein